MKEHNNPEKAKNAWKKPMLTVLVRNNPEESVLTACKMETGSHATPDADFWGCTVRPGNRCGPCDLSGTS